ncbi:hypothetical protein [Streptomyces sp. NPDC001401]|uniref:hypothetical protein n=1 Tax=Streptomyces sp. NPDC001401 TaxID=3364570 RepID=UPI0036A90AA9
MHGVGTGAARASKRTGPGTGKVGYTYLHPALDDHSRLAYAEALEDEKAVTAVALVPGRRLLRRPRHHADTPRPDR